MRAAARTARRILDFYVGDTISKNRATIDLGLRYDQQGGKALPSVTDGEPGVPDRRAGPELRRLRRAVHVEQPLAARRPDLRARRRAQDRGARELQPLRRPARFGQRRLHEPELVGGRGRVSLARPERRSSRTGRRSPAESVRRRGERLQPGEPDGGDVGEPDRPGPQGAGDAELRRRASIASCMPNFAVRRELHLHADDESARQRHVLGHAARRRDAGRLRAGPDADGHAARRQQLQRADLHPEPGEGHGRRQRVPADELGRLLHRLPRPRGQRRQAAVEPVDGARRRRVQQRPRALRAAGAV